MISCADYRAYAERLIDEAGDGDDAARATAGRELEFARIYADHDRLLAERGALDFGDLIVRAFRLLHERPHVRERLSRRFRHVLVDEYQDTNFAQAAAAARGGAPERDRGGRRRPGHLPLPRRLTEEPVDFGRSSPTPRWSGWSGTTAPAAGSSRRLYAVVEPLPARIDKRLTGAAAAVRLALPLGAGAGAGRCRRGRAPRCEGGRAAERDLRPRSLREERGPGDRLGAGGACRAVPARRLGRVLPARRGARRARLAAPPRRPERLRGGGPALSRRRSSSARSTSPG